METDEEIRRHVIDRVIDMGGEVFGATVDHGVVRLRGRVGMREDIPLVDHLLRQVNGVTGIEAWFMIGDERRPEWGHAKPVAPTGSSGPTRG